LGEHPFDDTPVVWGAAGEEIGRDEFQLPPVLGGVGSQNVGLADIPRDGDGVIRGYWREVPTQAGSKRTLGFAAVCLSRYPGSPGSTGDTEPRLLSFSRRLHWRYMFDTYSAGAILRAARDPAWRNGDLFRDKIVLVGGVYDEHERYWTPVGRMWGVEAIGQVIETELLSPDGRGGPYRPGAVFEVIASTILGVLLIVVFSLPFKSSSKFKWDLLASVVAIVAAPPVLSLLYCGDLAGWSSLVPIPLAVLFEEILYELHKWLAA